MKKNFATTIVLIGTAVAANAAGDSKVNASPKDAQDPKIEATDFNLSRNQALADGNVITLRATSIAATDETIVPDEDNDAVESKSQTVEKKDKQSSGSKSIWQMTKSAVKNFTSIIKEGWLAQGETLYTYGSYGYSPC